MAEEATGYELLRFAVTFIMSWKIWQEITSALSWFESDDILTKFEVLFNLACLLAYVFYPCKVTPMYNGIRELTLSQLHHQYD